MTQHLAALLERIADHDPDAMLSFYDRTAPRVFGVIGTRIAETDAREQVTERVYLEVWENANTYDPEAYSPEAWLITLAHRVTANQNGVAATAHSVLG